MGRNICIALLTLTFSASIYSKVTASVDRTVISELERVTLTISITDGGDSPPDFSVIRDFHIVSQ